MIPKQNDITVLPVRPGRTVFGVSATARLQGNKLYPVTGYTPITAVPVRIVHPAYGTAGSGFPPAASHLPVSVHSIIQERRVDKVSEHQKLYFMVGIAVVANGCVLMAAVKAKIKTTAPSSVICCENNSLFCFRS